MKTLFSQYFSSLKERGELDVIVPDMLSELGLNVFSRPGVGGRQYGVDVAAVGKLNGQPRSVYLISIKGGDLDRSAWDGNAVQSLRPSLNEIRDTYIPKHLPQAYRKLPINICVCVGGDILESVRLDLTSYIDGNTTDQISYPEWNGDYLSELLGQSLLHEQIMPKDFRPLLRKSLALVDEPSVSFGHFRKLVCSILDGPTDTAKKCCRVMRQLAAATWMLVAWAREENNLEAAYVGSEFALINSWDSIKKYAGQSSSDAIQAIDAFHHIGVAYLTVGDELLIHKILPHADKDDVVSASVRAGDFTDVNLKLFDLLGRLGVCGIWIQNRIANLVSGEEKLAEDMRAKLDVISDGIADLISHNRGLFLPSKDDQAIDIFLAATVLWSAKRDGDIQAWLREMVEAIAFEFNIRQNYPATISNYRELLDHPQNGDEYFRSVTSSSVLYPVLSFWAAQIGDKELFDSISKMTSSHLPHTDMQYWFPGADSEEHFYRNTDIHGMSYTGLKMESPSKFLKTLFDECSASPYYPELTAVKWGFLPLICIACRHYRYPIPLHPFNPAFAQKPKVAKTKPKRKK